MDFVNFISFLFSYFNLISTPFLVTYSTYLLILSNYLEIVSPWQLMTFPLLTFHYPILPKVAKFHQGSFFRWRLWYVQLQLPAPNISCEYSTRIFAYCIDKLHFLNMFTLGSNFTFLNIVFPEFVDDLHNFMSNPCLLVDKGESNFYPCSIIR